MSDVTLLHYTANVIPEPFAGNVRKHLMESAKGKPIISISQKPLDFGENICVGDIGRSVYNVYSQILTGAKAAKTKYVACCEDDTLYVPEHFDFEFPEDTFMYNVNYWRIHTHVYYYLERRGMCVCVAPTKLMVDTLETKFKAFPDENLSYRNKLFGEPGRFESRLGLPLVKIDVFRTATPLITFRHAWSLSGREGPGLKYRRESELPFWGKAIELWGRIYG